MALSVQQGLPKAKRIRLPAEGDAIVSDCTCPDSQSRPQDGSWQTRQLVFRLQYGKTSFLFTGDINGRKKWDSDKSAIDSEEKELFDRHNDGSLYSLKATVLQVSHHGSDGSSSS